jgi:hypothetical protein
VPFTTPPTFADGDYLTAANLNILSDDVEYLHARVHQVNTGFLLIDFSPGSGVTEIQTVHALRHFSNTFRWRAEVTVGTIDDLVIRYVDSAGTATNLNLGVGGVNPSAPYVWTGTKDITSLGFTVGDYYEIKVEVTGQTGSATNALQFYYAGEDF